METETYEIRVDELLSSAWNEWFDGIELRQEGSQTVMLIVSRDPALLYGVLAQLGNLHIPLVSVLRIDDENRTQTGLTIR